MGLGRRETCQLKCFIVSFNLFKVLQGSFQNDYLHMLIFPMGKYRLILYYPRRTFHFPRATGKRNSRPLSWSPNAGSLYIEVVAKTGLKLCPLQNDSYCLLINCKHCDLDHDLWRTYLKLEQWKKPISQIKKLLVQDHYEFNPKQLHPESRGPQFSEFSCILL